VDDTDIFKYFHLFRGEKGLLLRLYFLDVNIFFFVFAKSVSVELCVCRCVCVHAGSIHMHTQRVGSSYRLSLLSATESRCELCSLTPCRVLSDSTHQILPR